MLLKNNFIKIKGHNYYYNDIKIANSKAEIFAIHETNNDLYLSIEGEIKKSLKPKKGQK
ncbi:hypothetical protein [Mycoplasma sp. SG1]|uniref:hypothetical protein n=1 Tax=Mycoplasma sp. SG1 TaxID=2810348 RepID=UPI00202419D9|nr:hypothetical protein [Mycoplasma sp. SG1]URM53130.1 hypothetical protein JRW51_02155 [Mycoplasma sp. SG1]